MRRRFGRFIRAAAVKSFFRNPKFFRIRGFEVLDFVD